MWGCENAVHLLKTFFNHELQTYAKSSVVQYVYLSMRACDISEAFDSGGHIDGWHFLRNEEKSMILRSIRKSHC